jgi:hypothetical protein
MDVEGDDYDVFLSHYEAEKKRIDGKQTEIQSRFL